MKRAILMAITAVVVSGGIAYACEWPKRMVKCCKVDFRTGEEECFHQCDDGGATNCPFGWNKRYY